ncbi:hypothetical protein [Neorhodopirellula pilleata]|uniref:Uncharacterized protein n=1 Tax=Neorhodopirellula pilleata TaxID=2714738 RepID=A0A5C6AUP1_9BACT|nr:hypothetical protein [Neorhodopirellula pilleata]TWU03715.1 hypothetical protein Pla100_06450 [Neorhodopirellula pilleata]
MGGSFRDYLMGLSVLVLIMGGYQMTVARWLEPPTVDRAPIPKRVLQDNDETLVDLYPDDAWQRGRSIRLKTQDGMLLFQNWEQDTEDRAGGKKWRLWPITMVIGRGLQADGSEQPIVIEAAQGAVIEFSDSLDVMSGVAPTIQRGQLMGEVHIRRINARVKENIQDGSAYQVDPSAAGDQDQTLDIRTANVGIDRRKIWTTEAIHMQVGRATMVGRDLTLHLASSAGGTSSQSNISRSLDRMELIYLRDLTLPLGDANDPAGTDQGLVQIRCDGRIEYDFAMDQLLLDRKVRLVRTTNEALAMSASMHPGSTPIDPTESDPTQDRFECELLRLTLRDPLNSHRTRETAMDWIDRIEATGNPVRLSMPTQGFQLSASQVQFDPMEGWLIAEPMRTPGQTLGQSPTQRSDSGDAIRIQHGDLIAMLSRIVYRFNPKTPKQLGTVEVVGRGDLQYQSEASVLKSFRWRDSLRISPLDVATPDAMDVRFGVWCDGAIEATLSDGGTFTTDRIEGVLKPVTDDQKTALGQNNQPGSSINHQWFPDRFAAIGHVQVTSPTLVASTEQMNLFFEQKVLHPGTAVATESDSSIRQWVSQPGTSGSPSTFGSNPSGETISSDVRPPATIRGDEVTAKLTFGDRALTATDLSVIGRVEVTHPLELKQSASSQKDGRPSSLLAVLTGDHLRVRDGGGSDVLQLGSSSGVPARLQMGDGYFIGPEIQVRPDDNYVWIPSAGEFVLPSQFLPPLNRLSGSSDAMAGPGDIDSARWTRSPRCRFGGSMTFDGQVATLDGGVDLEAAIVTNDQPAEILARGDELKFILETPVELRTPATFQTTRLKQISLLQTGAQPVQVRVDQFTADGIRESRHELAVASLNWIPAQTPTTSPVDQEKLAGQLVAPGPGSYRGWIRGVKKDDQASSTRDTANSEMASIDVPGMIEDATNKPQTNPEEIIINGVHLVFQEAMRGDLLAKSLTFTRGVRIARRIVADFSETFEASDLDQLGLDDLTLDCDQVRLSIDPAVTSPTPKFAIPGRRASRQPPSLELEASSGVVFRSRTDRGLSEATADRCSYAVAKDLVTIQGIPGRPARFQQTDPFGKPVINVAIRTMTLRLKPFELLSSQIESINADFASGADDRNRK